MVWIFQIITAVILGQTLFFKFTGALESQYIFTTLGVEPWGRIAAGVIELLALILILVPALSIYGAALAAMSMLGAIMSHLLILGIVVEGEFVGQQIASDGGLLFLLANIVLLSSLLVIVMRRKQLPFGFGAKRS